MKKGFTLIELLVVIAIIGVMMAAVIVAINPTARLRDARDSNGKQVVAAVAGAAEACITKKLGDAGITEAGAVAACNSVALLVTAGYLKSNPATGLTGTLAMGTDGTGVCVSYDLEDTTNATCTFWKYTSVTAPAGKAGCATTTCV